ncbi:neutral zinc metallopeptidase [Nakamurella lactea]
MCQPKSADHGSSDQRVAWFTKGFNGDIESCLGNR